ncbi:flavin reductase family protein [Pseudomonas azerbaijanoccidens]|jgi:flavin reductase (DIM6/NTAB) family NADH-FMN oxidoreductase RutF|uniref:flavin reductase family protein n=1 Tax=Pseudomonas azerbaijanoccidentalis TaxID=2842347 RepID=UPI00200ABC8A|nr:flavin reductase family protein [Pseudomonas azerbaijanoccidentalis]MCK8664115.1 flavin reductase family protein [Pseudomonas azerbaijanoccidentalis]
MCVQYQEAASSIDVVGQFKSAMGRFASSLTLITTLDDEGQPHGLAATAFSSVSMEPASALICVNRTASASPIIKRSGLFCVNMLQSQHEPICKIFSQPDLRERRFVDGDWRIGVHGIRYLADAQAAIFCEVVKEIEHGTHTVIIGNVIDVITRPLVEPLLYMGGRYRELGC